MTRTSRRRQITEMILCALLAALAFAMKEAMAMLPNIEPVSLLLMVAGATMGLKALSTAWIYCLLECMLYGFNLWNLVGFFAWPIIVLLAVAFRRFRSPHFWAMLSGIYGFLYGFFFIPTAILAYEVDTPEKLLLYMANDLPFNLMHAGGNFIIALVIFCPLRHAIERALKKISK